ncbi:unnamed protein product [Amoebophrya sp. A25]|nr:unnamed protein product [Amoebophrya sp. A25]|eukprot:GSA25T00012804001.1
MASANGFGATSSTSNNTYNLTKRRVEEPFPEQQGKIILPAYLQGGAATAAAIANMSSHYDPTKHHVEQGEPVSPLTKEEIKADELFGRWIMRRFSDGSIFEGRIVSVPSPVPRWRLGAFDIGRRTPLPQRRL